MSPVYGQENDSTLALQLDSLKEAESADTAYIDEDSEYREIEYSADSDTLPVSNRLSAAEKVRSLRADPELNYSETATAGESLWIRFLSWLSQLIESFFDAATGTNLGRIIAYAVGLVLLVVIIMLILKVNAFRMLYSVGGKQKYQVLDENIHEMNFDKLLEEALGQKDYRRGIRLLFLYALKLLSDRHLIDWQSGKTNHDYAGELGKNELRPGFNELSFYFEYAWYGNFSVNEAMFQQVKNTFAEWKIKLSQGSHA